ncbi:Hypothetical predicted protein [Mytilus galloprovincialis]|uniref:C-type lectin domain-containing protein n=2 Tax=Mytilus galloprovincialis TaxID=29158 RepID=A0A8B6FME0_MYTGA|nr:Hypothetical predicted protein [Mytilus galloprovincialis]
MIAVLLVFCAMHVDWRPRCFLAKTEKSHLRDLRTKLKGFTKTIDDLEKGLKVKHFSGNDGCKKGWDRFRDYCYYFNKDKKSWFDAERHCQAEDSSLVNIVDENENKFVMTKSKEANAGHFWIGAINWDSGKWIWGSNFEPVKYFKWTPREPNGSGTSIQCVELYPSSDGTWNDHACPTTFAFVCKKHVVSA